MEADRRQLSAPQLLGPRDPDASLVVATVMGACMIPVWRPARRAETFRELERSLGLQSG